MALEVHEQWTSGYTLYKSLTNDTGPIHVDDLRGPDDPSLDPVPRITTFEQLVSVFKLAIATRFGGAEAPPGEEYFRLVGFYIRSGVAAFIPKVLDENGNPMANILVFAHWPDAPVLELPGGERPRPDYFNDGRGVAGFTNADGDIGFGFSGGAVIGPDGGVYGIWPAAYPENTGIRQHADCALKLGWHGATDHLVANPIFQIVTKSGDDPTPPPPSGGEHVLTQILQVDGVTVSRVDLPLTVQSTLVVTGG